jgi:hypothetical protein
MDVAEQLSIRAGRLESEIAEAASILKTMVPRIGRLVLLEIEYTRAVRKAELLWIRSLIDDIQSGRLEWGPEAIFAALASIPSAGDQIAKPSPQQRQSKK